ncbi:glycoside hydrolase Chb, partial [Streptomyces sp. CS090A]|uniref:glycoside hydrolase Chb n=2 Tax=Streptomyces TaxID=1883 RepID=UPI000D50C48B
TSYSYQWYANGKAIAKATGSKLTLKAAQRGKKITVKVTAHRTGHASGASTSAATKAVAR